MRFGVRCAVAAAALLWAWPAPAALAAAPVTAWCGAGELGTDRPDAVASYQWHVVYAIPSDGVDRFGTMASAIANDIAEIDEWWRGQDPTRAPRWDLAQFTGCSGFGALDISVLRLPRDTAAYFAASTRYGLLVPDVAAAFSERDKKYLVLYDAPMDGGNTCGISSLRAADGGNASFVWVDAERCGTVGRRDYASKTPAHEMLHSMGAVPPEAPHVCPTNASHTCDSFSDVMHGLAYGSGGIDSWILDVGHDDYYAHPGTFWDVQDSLWLRHLDGPQVQLAVSVQGAGSVTSAPTGVAACAVSCTSTWDGGTRVALTAQPADGMRLVRWTGACAGQPAGDCTLTLDGSTSVGAVFGPSSYRLTIAIAGGGSVTDRTQSIACVRTCRAAVSAREVLVLRAQPRRGYRFAGWSGACRGTKTCRVSMTQARAVGATFRRV